MKLCSANIWQYGGFSPHFNATNCYLWNVGSGRYAIGIISAYTGLVCYTIVPITRFGKGTQCGFVLGQSRGRVWAVAERPQTTCLVLLSLLVRSVSAQCASVWTISHVKCASSTVHVGWILVVVGSYSSRSCMGTYYSWM